MLRTGTDDEGPAMLLLVLPSAPRRHKPDAVVATLCGRPHMVRDLKWNEWWLQEDEDTKSSASITSLDPF